MNKWSVKIKSGHNEIFFFDLSKMFKIINVHFNSWDSRRKMKYWRRIGNGPCRYKTVFEVSDIARFKQAPSATETS